MIEEHLNANTYRWKKYAEFTKDDIRYMVVSEFTPSGTESDVYMLHEKDEKVFNQNDETVA